MKVPIIGSISLKLSKGKQKKASYKEKKFQCHRQITQQLGQ